MTISSFFLQNNWIYLKILRFFKSFYRQWQVISKFITCLVKLYIRCKSDVLKAKQSKDRAKTGRKGRKREESGVFSFLAFTPLCKQVSQQWVSDPPLLETCWKRKAEKSWKKLCARLSGIHHVLSTFYCIVFFLFILFGTK